MADAANTNSPVAAINSQKNASQAKNNVQKATPVNSPNNSTETKSNVPNESAANSQKNTSEAKNDIEAATAINPQNNSPEAKVGAPVNKSKKRHQKKRKLPVMDQLQEDVCKALRNCEEGGELRALAYALQPESEFMACIFEKIMFDIENVLVQRFRKFEIHPFGSSVCGMAFKTSDFDIYVDMKDLPDKSKKSVSRVIFQTIDTMKRLNTFEQTVAIINAKIPLLKCVHVKTGFSCDFSFTSPMGRYNSQIIRQVINLDHRIHPLILILKHWMKTRVLLGTGKITSYCLIMMVIFYLQHEKILRPLAVYQTQVPKFMVDKYWNLAWNNSVPNRLNNSPDLTISSLLRGFVDFYKKFDFKQQIICPLYGQTYDRATFALKPPPEFDAYIEYMKSDGACPLNLHQPMCVQDPFALNHNVAASCGSVFRYFILELCHASDMCQTQLKPGVTSAEFLLRFFTEFAFDPQLPRGGNVAQSNEFQVRLLPLEFELSVIRRVLMEESQSVPIEPDQVRKRWSTLLVLLIRFVLEELFKLQVNTIDALSNTNERLQKYQKLNGQKDVSDALEVVHWNVSGSEDVCQMKRLTKCISTTYFLEEATYATNKLQQLNATKKLSNDLNCVVSISSTPVDVHVLFSETGKGKKNATKSFYQNFTRSIRNHMKAYFLHCQRVAFVEPGSLLESYKKETKTSTKEAVVGEGAAVNKNIEVVLTEGPTTSEITI